MAYQANYAQQPLDPLTAQQQLLAIVQTAAQVGGTYDPNAHVRTQDFDKHTDRTYLVEFTGSLADFQRGTASTTWTVAPGNEHVYQRISGKVDGKPVFEGDLKKGILTEVIIEAVDIGHPVPIGLQIDGVEGTYYSAQGKSYAFIGFPRTKETVNRSVFAPLDTITRKMLEEHSDLSAEAMRSQCMKFDGPGKSDQRFVPNTSTLGRMLRLNAEAFGMNFNNVPENDEVLFGAPAEIVEVCLNEFEKAQKVRFVDFGNFKINAVRADYPDDWTHASGVVDNLRADANGEGGNSVAADKRFTAVRTSRFLVRTKQVLYDTKPVESPFQMV